MKKNLAARLPIRLSTLALAMLMPLAAHAHRLWLLPSATVFSDADPWVTVDAAVSNDLFFFEDFPLKLDGLVVTAPDGSQVKPENTLTGRHRSVFDVHLTQNGTYRIAVENGGVFATYKLDGQTKRWRGSVAALAAGIPAGAQDLEVTESTMRVESFVTRGKPDAAALKPTGHGLELLAVTHPNDLVAGSDSHFQLLLDGKPAPAVKVSVVPGGGRYRDQTGEISLTTDADGKFDVKWPTAGMYWLGAETRDDHPSITQAKTRRSGYAATFEVQPQ